MKDSNLSAVSGSARYEFRMQIRRKVLWIVTGTFCLMTASGFGLALWNYPASSRGEGVVPPESEPLMEVIAGWSVVVQFVLPLAVGLMLADRLPRDRKTGVDELLETLPAPSGERLLGKYLGATFATLVPWFLIYAGGLAYVAVDREEAAVFAVGMLALLAINLPGLLFVAAFSVACPAVIWVPLYQFLFIGYWFWGNLLTPGTGIPTISGTILTPIGGYVSAGLFGWRLPWIPEASVWKGIASIFVLLGLAALALLCAHLYLEKQRKLR